MPILCQSNVHNYCTIVFDWVFLDMPRFTLDSKVLHCSLQFTFGPGGLSAPPVVGNKSEAGHCFHLLFASFFGPCVLACATRGGGRSEAGYCFHLLFFLLFFFLLRLLLFTHFCFPPYFGINRRNI